MIRLSNLTDETAKKWLEIWYANFSPATRDPIEELAEDAAGESRFDFGLYLHESGLGLLRFGVLRHPSATFLTHIATAEAARGRGIGDEMWQWLHTSGRPVVLEVESPTTLEYQATWRWYSRRGVRVITDGYTQPSLGPGMPDVPLNLCISGVIPTDDETFVRDFFGTVWGRGADDELVRRALAGIPPGVTMVAT